MQQFLLFCTMLIIASEVFSKELHGSRIPRKIKRTSRFPHNSFPPSSHRYMFRRFNFPMFPAPPGYGRSVSQQPFALPLDRLKDVRPKRNKYQSLPKTNRFTNRKRSRRKYRRKKKWSPMPPPCFVDSFNATLRRNFWPSSLERNFSDFYRDEGGDFNPKQLIMCFYPVFIRSRKKTFDPLKNRRYLNFRRQYLASVRNKNKRSASNSTKDIPSDKWKSDGVKNVKQKNFETSIESYNFGMLPNERTSLDEKTETEGKNCKNLGSKNSEKENSEKYENSLGNTEYLTNMGENLYNPFLGVTLPTVTFKYPYDPKIYELPLRNEHQLTSKLRKQETTEETQKKKTKVSAQQDIDKLKRMLQEVQSMLRSNGDESCESLDLSSAGAKNKMKENSTEAGNSGSSGTLENSGSSRNSTDSASLRQKIDHVVPLLQQISDALGKVSTCSNNSNNLKSSNTSSSNSNHTNGGASENKTNSTSPCSADGTWTSSNLGFEMTFTTMPNLVLNVKVVSKNNAVINEKWSMQGLTLSKNGGPILLAGVYPQKKKMASFIGQCKMCRDQDLIFGSWTILSCVHRFSDLWGAVETKLDILRRKRHNSESGTKKTKKSKKLWFKRKAGSKQKSSSTKCKSKSELF